MFSVSISVDESESDAIGSAGTGTASRTGSGGPGGFDPLAEAGGGGIGGRATGGFFFEQALTRLTGKPTVSVASKHRPVPLDFEYRETPLHETVLDLIRKDRAPIYIVNFTQRGAAEEAQNLMSTDYSTR